MSLSTFLNELINCHNGSSDLSISIVDDNARFGIVAVGSNNVGCTNHHVSGKNLRPCRRSSDSIVQVGSSRFDNKKIHPALLLEKTKSDTALSMPKREDSFTSLISLFESGQKQADRWSHLINKTDPLQKAPKSHAKLHSKLFGDSALSIPSRVLSPMQRTNRNASKEKSSAAEIKNKMLSITSSALAIVMDGLDDFPAGQPFD